MDVLQELRTFKRGQFTVTAHAVVDYDIDTSFDETGEVQQKLDSGEYSGFGVIVTVEHDQLGEVGSDSLWGCIYESYDAFMDHKGIRALSRKDNCNYGSYFSDLISGAISEARTNIKQLQATVPAIKIN